VIVKRACKILDVEGLEALTLRRLSGDLSVGVASLYWYVDDKDDLIDQCYQATVGGLTTHLFEHEIDLSSWQSELRALIADAFDRLQQHPWVAELLSAKSSDEFTLKLWDHLGNTLWRLGLPDLYAFNATSALLSLLGSAGLTASREAYTDEGVDREAILESIAGNMAGLDPATFPFISRTLPIFRSHAERDQFLAGIDIMLDGIAAQVRRS
jgi:AcrR family transcriptional regulator